MMRLLCHHRFAVFLLVAVFSTSAFHVALSQVSDKVLSVSPSEAFEGQPLTIRAEMSRSVAFDRVLLAYRQFGQTEYKQIEMSLASNAATATIPAKELQPPFLEYYILLYVHGAANPETYPVENPENHPLKVAVRSPADKDKEVIVLSPERGERVTKDELVISVSLLRASSAVDKKRTKIFIGDADVTSTAVFSDDMILVRPENFSTMLKDGDYALRIELYDSTGNLYHSMSWPVSIVSTMGVATVSPIVYNGSVTLESRNESIAGDRQSYNRGSFTSSATYGDFLVRGKLYVTSEEKDNRQPQNRYFIGAESPWVKAGYGDAYPTFPRLIMEGKRLRGFTGNLRLGPFGLDVGLGDVTRKVEGTVLNTFRETDSTAFQNAVNAGHPVAIYDPTTNPRTWAEFLSGTFERKLFVVRPSFRTGDNFEIGLSYLKSKDDAGSIKYGVKPQENFVVGSDLRLAIDKAEITAQAGFSATNKNISGGSISDSGIAGLFRGDPDSAAKTSDFITVRDKLSGFMTINPFIVPLSLQNLTTLAYEGALALNYFDNYFKFSYMRRGGSYESFGQTFIRTDVQGFTIFDRKRLMENQLFISGGFERLEDNIGKTKAATTIFTTFSGTVSYYPRTDFPNVTVGYLGATNDNGLGSLNPRSADSTVALRAQSAVDDQSSRTYLQVGYDFVAGVRHSAAFNVGVASRDDRTFRNVDSKNTNVSLFVTTTYNIPLQTTASIALNLNKSSQFIKIDSTVARDFNYTSLLFNAQYRLMEEKLRLGGTISPTFGDFQRVVYDASAQYFFLNNVSLLFQLGIYQNTGASSDLVWALMFRFDV